MENAAGSFAALVRTVDRFSDHRVRDGLLTSLSGSRDRRLGDHDADRTGARDTRLAAARAQCFVPSAKCTQYRLRWVQSNQHASGETIEATSGALHERAGFLR